MFGRIIVAHRTRLGLTQEALADKTGLTARSLRELESGRVQSPRKTTVGLLADAFGLQGPDRDRFFQQAYEPAHAGNQPGPAGDAHLTVPAQLPADVAGFTGRRHQLAHLDGLLTSDGKPTAVVITAVSGTAGVGKTALAVHWAHRAAHHFPDGQLYVNLRGFDPGGPAADPGDAVRGLLDALGVAADRIPADLQAQVGLYRSLLARRRMLIILDNARDSAQVRPLLPGSAGCLVLVTSRDQLHGLVAADAAHPLTVDLLAETECRELLFRRLGSDRINTEPDAVTDIIASCTRLPLALAIVAARAAVHPHLSLTTLARQLRDTHRALDPFSSRDPATDVRAVFSWSYRTLSADAARLFRLLGLHSGPDVTPAAAASLAGILPHQARTLVAELTEANLLTEQTPGRLTLHDLLRAYAAERTHAEDGDDTRRAAVHRLLDHYLHTAHAAHQLRLAEPPPVTPAPPVPAVTPEGVTDQRQAVRWFTTEFPVLLRAIHQAAEHGFDTHAWQLASMLNQHIGQHGHRNDQVAALQTALAAARRQADDAGQAHAHHSLATAYAQVERYADAHTHFQHAIDLFDRLGDQTSSAGAHLFRSDTFGLQGLPGEALDHAEQGLHLYQAAGHLSGKARALSVIGWHHAALGHHHQALTHCRQALPLLQQVGHRLAEALTTGVLGLVLDQLGHHDQANAHYRRATDLVHDLGEHRYEAVALTLLGNREHAAGRPDAARDLWQRALAILEQPDTSTDDSDSSTKLGWQLPIAILEQLDPAMAGELRAKLHSLTHTTAETPDPERSDSTPPD